MPDLDVYPDPPAWHKAAGIALIALLCISLVLLFKTWGALISLVLIGVLAVITSFRRNDGEAEAIKASIRLSADEITDTIDSFNTFLTGTDTASLADRTLHRPELANKDSLNPDIEKFYYLYGANVRYLHRLQARLAQNLTVTQAEHLLTITDQRALELQESWLAARRAAYQLGPGKSA
ncbi:hypothetical protein QVA66_01380 [Staphylococcus chromogenes]|nr:hypothetical protein [Staphylococcus chromogenes]